MVPLQAEAGLHGLGSEAKGSGANRLQAVFQQS